VDSQGEVSEKEDNPVSIQKPLGRYGKGREEGTHKWTYNIPLETKLLPCDGLSWNLHVGEQNQGETAV
jgi:hypothetical protein